MNGNGRILILDDEEDVGAFLAEAARDNGFEAEATSRAEDFVARLDAWQPDMIMLDLQMPDCDGIEVLRLLAPRKSKAAIVVMSGMEAKVLQSALRLGKELGLSMAAPLQKPATLEELDAIFQRITASRRNVTAGDLADGIRRRELVLHFQPKVSLSRDNYLGIAGCEALARWQHPRYGLLGPAEFIPLAERNDLIDALTHLVLEQALDQAQAWRAQGLDLSIAVNMAPQTLSDLTLPDRLREMLRERKLDSRSLVLEITETGAMKDAATMITILTRFRIHGVQLSIDDFGTGYSSLIQLYRLPFSELKVDHSFVIDLAENEEAKTIVTAVVKLAHNLGLKSCAEGVENEQALQYLASLGCDLAQGFHISRPLPAAAFLPWVNGWEERRAGTEP